jgi:tryptophan-rich sensory protein
METFYTEIIQPSFAPPSWVFGPVWTLLYVIIILSFGYVANMVFQRKLPFSVLLPLAINIVSNILWTTLFFRFQNFDLALLDILIVWGSILWIGILFWNKKRWISYAQIPYFLWVSFATVLMFAIWMLN